MDTKFALTALVSILVPQEILQKYSARQLRLAFLTQLWNSKVDFSESLMTGEVRGIEIAFNVRMVPCVYVKQGARMLLHTHNSHPELLHQRQSACLTSGGGRTQVGRQESLPAG